MIKALFCGKTFVEMAVEVDVAAPATASLAEATDVLVAAAGATEGTTMAVTSSKDGGGLLALVLRAQWLLFMTCAQNAA